MSFGQRELERMIDEGSLEVCPPDAGGADRLIAKARIHHGTALSIASSDPESALDALHAGNRKSLEAVLLKRGLRPTKIGGHIAASAAVGAIFGRRALGVYDTVRRLRHEGDYLSADYDAHPDDVLENLADSKDLVDACAAVLPGIPVFRYGET